MGDDRCMLVYISLESHILLLALDFFFIYEIVMSSFYGGMVCSIVLVRSSTVYFFF